MTMATARFTLRIHPLVMKKMKVIADYNGRSVNKEIEQILKWIIDDFESKRGKIRPEELELIEHPEKKLRPMEPAKKNQSSVLFKL
jgi:hypothetical protein